MEKVGFLEISVFKSFVSETSVIQLWPSGRTGTSCMWITPSYENREWKTNHTNAPLARYRKSQSSPSPLCNRGA